VRNRTTTRADLLWACDKNKFVALHGLPSNIQHQPRRVLQRFLDADQKSHRLLAPVLGSIRENGWFMKAARVLRFGPPSVITNDDVPQPEPGAGQLLVRVKAAGVGNWDALIREGKVELQPLPIILGSELSGIVEAIGSEVSGFKVCDEVYRQRTSNSAGHTQNMRWL
jgi:Alcohol dehydrogenase GroES-like domain